MESDSHSGRKSLEKVRPFLTFSGFRYWTTSLLPTLVGTTLPFWLRSPGWSFTLIFGLSFALRVNELMKIPSRNFTPSADWELGAISISLKETWQFADPYMIPTDPTAYLPPHIWFGPLHNLKATAMTSALTLLAFLGQWRSWNRLLIPLRAILLIPLVTYPLIYYLVAYLPRYRVPIDWLLFLLWGSAIWYGIEPEALANSHLVTNYRRFSMQPFIWISLLVLTLVVIAALIVAGVAIRKSVAGSNSVDTDKQSKGYWISIGMSIGAGFGVALGLVFDNLALGIALGAGFGVAIGAALEQRNKDKIRPLTAPEQRLQRWGIGLGLLLLLVFVGIFVLIQLLGNQ